MVGEWREWSLDEARDLGTRSYSAMMSKNTIFVNKGVKDLEGRTFCWEGGSWLQR